MHTHTHTDFYYSPCQREQLDRHRCTGSLRSVFAGCVIVMLLLPFNRSLTCSVHPFPAIYEPWKSQIVSSLLVWKIAAPSHCVSKHILYSICCHLYKKGLRTARIRDLLYQKPDLSVSNTYICHCINLCIICKMKRKKTTRCLSVVCITELWTMLCTTAALCPWSQFIQMNKLSFL